MSVNTQQRICRVISQQMYFSQHFARKFCLENACRVMFTDICCHLTDMTFLGAIAGVVMSAAAGRKYVSKHL